MSKFQNITHVDGQVMYNVNPDCQFISDMKLWADGGDSMTVNGQKMPRAYWNLICSIRDVSLYNKGIRIHRHWKITPVKKYFGFSGHSNDVFLEYLKAINQNLVETVKQQDNEKDETN